MQVSRRVVAAVVGVMVGMVAAVAAARAQYTVSQTGDIVQLRDETADMTVSVLTSTGNAYEVVVKGKNLMRLQSVPPGGSWVASFWIRTSGY